MGCGASNTAGAISPVDGKHNGKGEVSDAQERGGKPEKLGLAADKLAKEKEKHLLKINSQLGNRAVVNSFVVQKQRSRRRESETGNKKDKADDEFAKGSTFHLPAENAALAQPDYQGVSVSGPSFKMARGAAASQRAAMLKALNSSGADRGVGGEASSGKLTPGGLPEIPEASVATVGASVEAEESLNMRELALMDEYKPKLFGSSEEEIMEAVVYFREQLSMVNPPVRTIRDAGIVPRLVELLERDANRKLQYEVAWALTNICSAEHEDCMDVVNQGALTQFVRLLTDCDDLEVIEQVIWALGNIAADSSELQLSVLSAGVVDPLVASILRNVERTPLLRHSTWLVSNLTRPKPQTEDLYRTVPMIKTVLEYCSDDEVATHAVWALAYISGDEDALDNIVEHAGVLTKLVGWVGEANSSMTTPSLRVLGNLCSGSSEATQAVVDAGGVSGILSCLKATTRVAVKKECIWSLSNMAAGTDRQVEALADSGVYPEVIALMQASDESLRKECAYVLANPWAATVNISLQVAKKLLDQGLVQVLADLLKPDTRPDLLVVSLEGLHDAVKKGQRLMMFTASMERSQADAAAAAATSGGGGQDAEGGEAEGAGAANNAVAAILRKLNIRERLEAVRASVEGNDVLMIKYMNFSNAVQFL